MRQSLAPRRRAQGPVGLRRFNAAAGNSPGISPASAGSFARCWHCQSVIRLFLTAFPSPSRRDGGKHGPSQGNETAQTAFPLQWGISDFMWKDNHSRMGQCSVMAMATKKTTRSATRRRIGRRDGVPSHQRPMLDAVHQTSSKGPAEKNRQAPSSVR